MSDPTTSKVRVQAQVEMLPLGSGKTTVSGQSMSQDAALAYGISGAIDYAITPYLSIGVAPRLVLNVKPSDTAQGEDADKEIDLRAHVLGHIAVSPGLELYASLAPGYAIVTSSQEGTNTATGFAIGGAVGASYDVSPKMFVAAEVGYQRAFTSSDVSFGGQTISADLDLSYMHVALGAGTRF